ASWVCERYSVENCVCVPRTVAFLTKMGSKYVCGISQLSEGEANSWSACLAGWVPQVRIRPISSPASEVQNTVSPIVSCGVASAMTWYSMPTSRKISMVRWLVICARGVLAVQRYLVIVMLGTPSVDRKSAAAAPAGPDPTTKTSASTSLGSGVSVSLIASAKVTISRPLVQCVVSLLPKRAAPAHTPSGYPADIPVSG